MTRVKFLFACASLGLLTSGCSEAEPPAQEKPASLSDFASQAPTDASVPITPPSPTIERVKAEVGVGKKGHGYGGGIITEPVHQYFAIKERIPFEIEIPHALQLYKASHDFKGPKTHEAFMKEIVEFNGIKLPELPEGHRYVYDPKTEELQVERPVESNQDEE